MSTSKQFCPGCGSPRKPGAKFCNKCRLQFDEPGIAEQVAGAAQNVARTVQSVESTVSRAGAAVRTAAQVKNFVIAPPAQWKVVIGDRLPGMGEAAVTKAADIARQKAESAVTAKVEEVVKDILIKSPEKDEKAEAPAPSHLTGQVCPSCRNPLTPGKKFCGSCGAAIVTVPPPVASTCPHCGSPVRPGVKFCGSCGKKIV